MDKDTIQHYNRMWQRTDILFQKPEWKWKVDFMANMVEEHLSFYTKQWFSVEEANVLISIPARVRDFFGLKVTSELYKLIDWWEFVTFFNKLKEYFTDCTNEFGAFELEALFQQMTGRKTIKESKEWIKNNIHSIINSEEQNWTEKIYDVLRDLSYYYFENWWGSMSRKKVSGEEVISQIDKTFKNKKIKVNYWMEF